MKRLVWAMSLAVMSSAVAGSWARASEEPARFTGQEAEAGMKSRTFNLIYTAKIDKIPDGAKKLELWAPIPSDTAHQKITGLKFSLEPASTSVEPVYGNRMAYWKFEGDAVKAQSISMSFTCERKEITAQGLDKAQALAAEETAGLQPFLRGYKLVLVGDPIKEVVETAVGRAETPQAVSKAAYDYVLSHMKYSKEGTGWGQGSTQWACDAKYGNCTDFHALFMSIAMTKGIPVKFEMGIMLPEDKTEGEISGYHCWAKFYLGGVGWVPVDISEAWKQKEKYGEYYYGHLTPDRVQFSTGREINLAPRQAGEALNYFIYPYAEADGKSIPTAKAFSFKNVEK